MPISKYGGGSGGSGSGDVTFTDLDRDNVIYVSKDGSDLNDGENIGQPKLTIASALTAATAKTPSASNTVLIEVLDSGVYASGSVTIPSYVYLYAPKATLEGTYDLADDATLNAFTMQNASGTELIAKTTGTGLGAYNVAYMYVASGETGVASTSGDLSGRIGYMSVVAGTGIDSLSASSKTYADIDKVELASGAVALNVSSSNTDIDLRVGTVTDDTTCTAINCNVNGATINFMGVNVVVTSLYNIAGNSTLNFSVAKASGARAAITTATVLGFNPTADSAVAGDITVNVGGTAELTVGEELLEVLSTGVTSGGALSIGTPNTTYDVASGTGHVIDADAGEYFDVAWSTDTGRTPPVTDDTFYVYVDELGVITESLTELTSEQRRDNVYLGRVAVVGGVVVAATSEPETVNQPVSQLYDLGYALKTFNIEGNILTPNGANLSFDKSAGTLFELGSNYQSNPKNPHEKSISVYTPCTFFRFTQNGATTVSSTTVDPSNYDVGGVLTPIGGSNNQATNMRVYLFSSGNMAVGYGQTVYSTLAQAIQGINSETPTLPAAVANDGLLVGIISVTKGATDLSDPTQAKLLRVSRFGETSVGGAGASVSNYQNVYDNSGTSPQTITDATNGAIGFQSGTGADADNVFEIKNNAGTTTFDVSGAGDVAMNSLSMSSNIDLGTNNIVNGGSGAFTGTLTSATLNTGQGDNELYAMNQPVQTTDNVTFNNISPTGTVDGRDIATDGTKLDGIEAGAEVNQTDAEIKTQYEANANTNAFTDAEQTKLSGIEAGADVTDEANVVSALDGATLTSVTVATDDKVIIQDTSDSNNVKTVTAQSIADLASGGGGGKVLGYDEVVLTGASQSSSTTTWTQITGASISYTKQSATSIMVCGLRGMYAGNVGGQSSFSNVQLNVRFERSSTAIQNANGCAIFFVTGSGVTSWAQAQTADYSEVSSSAAATGAATYRAMFRRASGNVAVQIRGSAESASFYVMEIEPV